MEIENLYDATSKLSLGKLNSQSSTKIDKFEDSEHLFSSIKKSNPFAPLFGSVKKLKIKSNFQEKVNKALTESKLPTLKLNSNRSINSSVEKENLKLRRNLSSQKTFLTIDKGSNIIRASPLPRIELTQSGFKPAIKTNDNLSDSDDYVFSTPIKPISLNKETDPQAPGFFGAKLTPVEGKNRRMDSQEISRIIFNEDTEEVKSSRKTVSVMSFGEKQSEFEVMSHDSEISFNKENTKTKFTLRSDNPIHELEFELSFQNFDILRKEINKTREMNNLKFDILQCHEDLNYYMRAKLTDWVREAGSELGLRRETIHHSIMMIDKYLKKTKKFDKNRLQLLALGSMLVSSKIEEIQSPSTKNFSYMSNNAFSPSDIMKMEREICKALEWKLTFVSLNSIHGALTEEWDFYLENSSLSVLSENSEIVKILKMKNCFFRARNKESYVLFCESSQVMDTLICNFDYNELSRVKLIASVIFLCLNRKIFLDAYRGVVDNSSEEILKSSIEIYNVDLCDYFNKFLKNIDFALQLKNMEEELNFVKKFFMLEFFYGIPIGMKLKGNHVKRESYEEFLSLQTHSKNALGVVWLMMQESDKRKKNKNS